MSNRTVRLLNSLKLLAQAPDGWLFRTPGSPEPDEPQPDASCRDHPAAELRRAFPAADDQTIEALSAICAPMSVPAGAAVVASGDPPDAVYIVGAGLFVSCDTAADGREVLLDRFGSGDVFGAAGLITGAAQTATIRAMRNSELLRISKPDLQAASLRCPGVWPALCSTVVQRLQRARPIQAVPFQCRTFCVVPADPTIDTGPIVRRIARTLEAFGSVTIVSADQAPERQSGWSSEAERRFDFVLFQTGGGPTAWTRFCLRQCDRVVVVATGNAAPADCEALGPNRSDVPKNTPLSLLLVWQDGIMPGRTAAWLKSLSPGGHHHIRSPLDIERAARLIAGRGCGLVLSGGGAKALAHLGVIDALRKHNVPIDVIGGTSIGAIVAAVCALEWDHGATVRSLAAAFNRRRFSDFALPRTALYSERAFARTLGRCFGDLDIEDAPVPLFCVSTNLTQRSLTVHRTGRLVTWLRAASAVPGICPPIMANNMVYVDGGVLDNMPTDAIRDFGVASVIAVDVGYPVDNQERLSDGVTGLPNMLDLLWRVGTIGSDAVANRAPHQGDVIVRPDVAHLGLFEWDAHECAIAAGHQAALDSMDEITSALGRLG
jgi:NTE family protein